MLNPLQTSILRFITSSILLSIVSISFAQTPGSRPEPVIVEVNGQVRYAGNNAPAEKVLVRLEGFGSGVNGQTMTDSSGKFRFSGLGQAQYIVTVRAPGYLEASQQVDLQTMPRAYLNFQLVAVKTETTSSGSLSGLINAKIAPEAQLEFDKGRAALIEIKNVESGISHLERAIKIDPAFLEAHLLLGTAYLDAKQWEKAERELRRTTEMNPKLPAPFFALGEAYRRQHKFAEAEKALQDGFKLEPKSAQGHLTLGQVYFEKGDLAKAGPEAGQALQLKPDLAEAYLLAGNLFLKARNAVNALQMFEQYLKLEPKGQHAAQTREMVEKIKKALAEKKQ